MGTTGLLPTLLEASYSFPDHCTPISLFLVRLSSAFGSCVPTSLALLSTTLGVFSIIAWLFAQAPQIWKNHTLQSASGLSIYFLAVWLLGDLTNLLGALLTSQAVWQVIVASYYVTVDVILCFQYFWYTYLRSDKMEVIMDPVGNHDGENGDSSGILVGIAPTDESSLVGSPDSKDRVDRTKAVKSQRKHDETKPTDVQHTMREKRTSEDSHPFYPKSEEYVALSVPSPKLLFMVTMLCVAVTHASPPVTPTSASPATETPSEFAGRILSWTSTLLYLGSRLPQIFKNAYRHSTAGLSPTLFAAAFCGNFFYSSSMLTNPLAWSSYPPYGLHGWVGPEGSDRRTWVALAAPFFLGAAGVLVMDAFIGMQFLMYGEGLEQSILVEDREGRSKWRTLRGWMRGWVPSPSPDAKVIAAEEEDGRPLLLERDRDNYGAV